MIPPPQPPALCQAIRYCTTCHQSLADCQVPAYPTYPNAPFQDVNLHRAAVHYDMDMRRSMIVDIYLDTKTAEARLEFGHDNNPS